MERRCPFCWDQSSRKVASVVLNGTGLTRTVRQCLDCEKWYLEETGEEISELSQLCLNLVRKPGNCRVATARPARGSVAWSPRTKIKELNHLCSDCSHKRFFLPKIGKRGQAESHFPIV